MDVLPLPAPPAREHRLLPTLAVVLVLLLVVAGGYVTAAALSSPAGPPVDVGGRVRIHPLSGWDAARGDPTVRLTRGSATLDLAVFAFRGSAAQALGAYVTRGLEPAADQLSVSRGEEVTVASGLPGVRIFYVGSFAGRSTPVEGQVTAVVSGSGVGVVFDGWAPSGLLQYALDDINTMVDRAEVA